MSSQSPSAIHTIYECHGENEKHFVGGCWFRRKQNNHASILAMLLVPTPSFLPPFFWKTLDSITSDYGHEVERDEVQNIYTPSASLSQPAIHSHVWALDTASPADMGSVSSIFLQRDHSSHLNFFRGRTAAPTLGHGRRSFGPKTTYSLAALNLRDLRRGGR